MFDCEILLTITGRRSDRSTPPPLALRSSVRYCYTNRPAHYSVSCLMRLSVFNLYRHCAGAQRRIVFGCTKYRTAVANVQELLGLRSRSPHVRISGQKCCAEFTYTCVVYTLSLVRVGTGWTWAVINYSAPSSNSSSNNMLLLTVANCISSSFIRQRT